MEHAPQTIYLDDYAAPAFLIDALRLRIELEPARTLVHSEMDVRRNPDAAHETQLVLDGVNIELLGVAIDGEDLAPERYSVDDASLCILDVGDAFTLATTTACEPAANTCLEGLYVSSDNFCTQCEPQGFRRITYYLDRPDVLARFTTTLIASPETCPVLLGNGNPVESGECDDGRHWVTWEDPFPKPAYLFALVAGRLEHVSDSFTTRSGRDVRLSIYVQAHNIHKCEHAMRALKAAMRWDEEVYGLEYDLDIFNIVAVDDFNMGAMENKGLNVFNSKYILADPRTATDSDFQAIEGVVAHEYFHNWTGNRVTLRDWFQLSLKEGLTVFRDQEFSADVSMRDIKRIEDVRLLRQRQFAEDAGPMAHAVRPGSYVEINNFYTLTVYEKGAELIRMLHTLLGEDFQRAASLYLERHDGQAATCDDFLRAMADVSGRDLGQFSRWYSQAGTPQVRVTSSYLPESGVLRMQLEQHTPPTPGQQDKQPLHIPLKLALLDEQGEAVPLRIRGDNAAPHTERVLELHDSEQTIEFEQLASRPVPSLLRGFSAPVKLETDFSDQDLAFLVRHDTDSFNRWDACQTLALRVLNATLDGEPGEDTLAAYVTACRTLLNDDVDAALRAESLTLPGEDYIGEARTVIDVDAVFAAREQLRRTLAVALADDWRRVHAEFAAQGDYLLDPAAIGRRRLRNLALDYLCVQREPAAIELAREQFAGADNMTDQMAALRVLVETGEGTREQPLEQFYAQWQDTPLVIDKWFTVQALSRVEDTLARVKRLREHPAFDLRNPNRVRSLLGAFAMSNPTRFHSADGAGYVLLADTVLELNALNPQIAARLAAAFTRWRRYDSDRQQLMRNQLERMSARSDLSRDVFEIVSKTLTA